MKCRAVLDKKQSTKATTKVPEKSKKVKSNDEKALIAGAEVSLKPLLHGSWRAFQML